MLIGAGIALAAISLFLFPIKDPNPAWGKFWMVRPLIIVPLAGAAGGALFHIITTMSTQKGWKKILVIIGCILIYIIGLWMGTVLGLDSTLFD